MAVCSEIHTKSANTVHNNNNVQCPLLPLRSNAPPPNSAICTQFTATYAVYSKASPIHTTTSFAAALAVNMWADDIYCNSKDLLEFFFPHLN